MSTLQTGQLSGPLREKELPFISVVVPCRNEGWYISQCLDSILCNGYPLDKMEVLVVDGMSDDGTREVVGQYAARQLAVWLVDNPKRHFPAAMNVGICNALGSVVVIMSAHSTYEPGYLLKCVTYLQHSEADNVGGIVRSVPAKETTVSRAIARSLSESFGSGNSYVKIGSREPRWADTAAFGCYRREVFDRIGLFDENLLRSSDMDLNLRLTRGGGKILLVPDIVANYYPQTTFRGFLRHNLQDGIWVTYPLKYGRRVFGWRHVVPMSMIVAAGGLSALGIVWSPFWWFLLALSALYALLIAVTSARVALRERQIGYLWALPIAFVIRHLAYGLGSVVGLGRALASPRFWLGMTSSKQTERAETDGREYCMAKRLMDIILASVAIIILTPVYYAVGLWIKLGSPGPIFYRGTRIGRGGRPFRIFKFRTMVANADQVGGPSTSADDPRVTRAGRVIRRFNLDELPQFINVLRGEMSIVGPRPEVPEYVAMFNEEEKAILSVRPGITDWATVWIRDEGKILEGAEDPEAAYMEKIWPEKHRLELQYVRERSLWVDAKIMAITLKTHLFDRLR